MTAAERYARSVRSSNLKDDAHNHHTCALQAMASVPMGSELHRLKYCNDATVYKDVMMKWSLIVEKKSVLRKWPKEIRPEIISKLSLNYWLNPVCPDCFGVGFNHKLSKSGQYDVSCKACSSTGIKPVKANPDQIKYVNDMIETLDCLMQSTARSASAKLKGI